MSKKELIPTLEVIPIEGAEEICCSVGTYWVYFKGDEFSAQTVEALYLDGKISKESIQSIEFAIAWLDQDQALKVTWGKSMYVIREAEAGNVLDEHESLEEAIKVLREYERQDIGEGCFRMNFYEIWNPISGDVVYS